MEPRELPATFAVTSLADVGPGSLREAIERANAAPDRDTVTFATGLVGTIELAGALPDLDSPIDLAGPGASALTIARSRAGGTPQFRLISVSGGAEVTLSGLTLAGGSSELGGAVRNSGTLAIIGATIRDSTATGATPFRIGASGGAIENSGLLSIVDSTLVGNRSTADATRQGGEDIASGGAISNSGTLTIAGSTFEDNLAVSTGVELLGNSVASLGGAIRNLGTLTVTASTFIGNQAISSGGITGDGSGGAIANSGTLTVADSTLSGNQASGSGLRTGNGSGGAIANTGTLTVTGSTLSGNQASGSGGIGGAGGGGAIENRGSRSAIVANSTISGNTATVGGGISNDRGTLTIANATLSGNSGGGIYNFTIPPSVEGQLTIVASVLVEGTGGTLVNASGAAAGRVSSLGSNLFSDAPDVPLAPTDRIDTDARLGPLADNGGPTMTHALLPGSPAIDAGVPLEGISTDQRGIPRPQGSAPDIGAFESRGFTLAIVSGNNQDTPVGTPFPEPLTVRVVSPAGEPVSGGLVRFEATESGPTARLISPAVIGPDGLASTSAVASDQPGTYTVVAASAGAAPAQFTLTNRLGVLKVVNVARVGFHARPTRVDLTFNLPLDPAQASRVENYRLLGPGLDRAPGVRPDRSLRLRSASFDAATNTVRLVPAEPLRLLGGRRYLVVVDGAVQPGGPQGVATTATIGAEDFVPTPALSRQLNLIRQLQRFRDGTGRLH